MSNQTATLRNAARIGAVVCFGLTLLVFSLNKPLFPVAVVLAAILGLLGLVIVILTRRLPEPRWHRVFALVTGISAAAIPISVVLHNLVYALCIALFGEGFWEGSDEPFFFILAIIVFPALFVIGVVGSTVLLIRSKAAKTDKQ
jgi:hypothetical protein